MDRYRIPVTGEKTYVNPLPVKNLSDLPDAECAVNGDPFVLKSRGEYWCYSTGEDGVHLLRSEDLVTFEHLGLCLREEGAFSYWAPCVLEHNGTYYMYYSSNPVGDDDDHAHYLKLAVADHPRGPFRYVKQFFDTFSIDAHAVKSVSGRLFLFYSVNNAASTRLSGAGTAVVMDELLDPYTLAGDPVPVIMPTLRQEIFAVNRFGDGRDWHTIEGACYFEHARDAYILYSANAFTSPDYFLGVCRGDICGDMREAVFRKVPDPYTFSPFIAQNDLVAGTGHCSVVRSPDNTDDYVVYHGYDRKRDGELRSRARSMRIDPILYGKGRLYTPAPTSVPQDAPRQPYFRALYNGDAEGRETPLSGDWNMRESCLCQDSKDGVSALILRDMNEECALLRVSVRWIRHHYGGKYGVYAAWAGEKDRVEVFFDQASRRIVLAWYKNGVMAAEHAAALPPGTDFERFHDLTVRRTGVHFTVWADDLRLIDTDCLVRSGTVGLFTAYTRAMYDSFEVTRSLALDGRNAAGFALFADADGGYPEKNWEVLPYEVRAQSGEMTLREEARDYRFSAWCESRAQAGSEDCGLIASLCSGTRVTATLRCGRAYAEKVRGSEREALGELDCGRGEKITVIREGGKLVILLGARVLAQTQAEDGSARCGFVCGSPSAFEDIEYRKL